MARFIIGVVVGVFIGSAATSYAAGVFGSGYLTGWTVVTDGEEVCSDPYVWDGTKEMECD
jgi:hypothetical protein